tara:strand:- start:17 stop:946 length:930 start_codon:yes stop_codon:yes gene_type:complete
MIILLPLCFILSNGFNNKIQKKYFTKIRNTNDFYTEGDYSGSYQLSGLWKIYIEPDKNRINYQKNKLGWSGNIWNSNTRKRFKSMYLYLHGSGSFNNLKHTDNQFFGKWSCDNNEITLTRFKFGYSAIETFYGSYNHDNGTISGLYSYGSVEPEYSGMFVMKNLMNHINPIKENIIPVNDVFTTNQLLGIWQLQFESDFSYISCDIELHKNLTWSSINSEYLDYYGNWNICNKTLDLTSGIHGTGYQLWLLLRRFNKIGKDNINLDQDRLYVGKINKSPLNNLPRNIKGDVSIGWLMDTEFIGSFRMRR